MSKLFLSVVILVVLILRVIMLSVLMPTEIMLSFGILRGFMVIGVRTSAAMLSVTAPQIRTHDEDLSF